MPTIHLTRKSGFEKGKSKSFTSSPVILGTDDTSSLRFDPVWDKTVSPRHLSLIWRDNSWWLENHSTFGTFIDGQRIAEQKLGTLTLIELGSGGPKVEIKYTEEPMSFTSNKPSQAQKSFSKKKPDWILPTAIAGGILLALLIGIFIWFAIGRHNADEALAAAARKHEGAVGLVVIETANGPQPCATAWAIDKKLFATNSHVTESVREALAHGATVFIVINKHPSLQLHVTAAYSHPKYSSEVPNLDGKPPAVPAYDVGLLVTDEPAPDFFPIASESELRKLHSGYRVAYLGFPMEGLTGGGVDFRNPVATMQSGIITAVTDFWLSNKDFKYSLLIEHNLGLTGGASGSPLFNDRGEVVGIVSAMNTIRQAVPLANGQIRIARAPSGVMINFAQRIDLLNELVKTDH